MGLGEDMFQQGLFEEQFLHHTILEPPINHIQALGNWTRLADILYEENLCAREIKRLIKYELQHKGRLDIVKRLHGRYNNKRCKDEKARLEQWLKNQKRKLSHT